MTSLVFLFLRILHLCMTHSSPVALGFPYSLFALPGSYYLSCSPTQRDFFLLKSSHTDLHTSIPRRFHVPLQCTTLPVIIPPITLGLFQPSANLGHISLQGTYFDVNLKLSLNSVGVGCSLHVDLFTFVKLLFQEIMINSYDSILKLHVYFITRVFFIRIHTHEHASMHARSHTLSV